MNTEKKKRVLDDYPLFGYDKDKIEQYFMNCSTLEEKNNYLRQLKLKLKICFVCNNSNEYKKDFEQWYSTATNMVILIDYNDFNGVYLDYLSFIEALSEYISSEESNESKTSKKVTPFVDCKKFVWLGTQEQLGHLFDKLHEEGLIESKIGIPFYALIAKYFEGKDGKVFTSDNLKSSAFNAEKKPSKGTDKVDRIVEDIK